MYKIRVIVISLVNFFFIQMDWAQNFQNNIYHQPLIVIDTIIIDDPVLLLLFTGRDTGSLGFANTLVSKKTLNPYFDSSITYRQFLLTYNCYRLLEMGDFNSMLDHCIENYNRYYNTPFYNHLHKVTSNYYLEDKYPTILIDSVFQNDTAENPIHLSKHLEWEYYKVAPKKFLICLIKGDLFYKGNSCYKPKFGLEDLGNMYFQTAIPFIWK